MLKTYPPGRYWNMYTSDLADEYFNRSVKAVRGRPEADRFVRYAVFSRDRGRLCGVSEVVDLVNERCEGPVKVEALPEGGAYHPKQIVMTLEGRFIELVALETEYLGMLSLSSAAGTMAEMVETAGDVLVIDMAARHFPPELIPRIAVAAAVGGARGTSTRAGHAEVHARFGIGGDRIRVGQGEPHDFKLYGTIPHALNAVFDGSSIESAAAYHEICPEVPLTVLTDFEGRERDIVAEAVERFGIDLYAVRLDTPGNRVHQGGHEKPDRALEMRILSAVSDRDEAMVALGRHGFGPGVTIEAAYAIRDLLDRLGARSTKVIVSSGFTLQKVRDFITCKAPIDGIGTGSWMSFSMFTSDITHVRRDGEWVVACKAGRQEELDPSLDLPVVFEKGGT